MPLKVLRLNSNNHEEKELAESDLPDLTAAKTTSGTFDIARIPTITVAKGGTNTTSYTKGDILVASASTTLTKRTVGANGTVLTADSAESTGVKWATPATSAGITVYSVTTADCENTASEIDVISFTVPANTWKDGENLQIIMLSEGKQNSGSSLSFTVKTLVNSTEVMASTGTLNNASNVGRVLQGISFIRYGTALMTYNYENSSSTQGILPYLANAVSMQSPFYQDNNLSARGRYSTSFAFDTDIVIVLNAKWASAHANAYLRIIKAAAYKLNS